MTYTKKSWSETKAELREAFAKWAVTHWDIECESTQYSRAGLNEDQRRVLVWYVHPTTGDEVRLETAQFERPMDNLRAIYLTVDALRLSAYRGTDGLMRQAFLALPAPAKERDPWEVLGLRPDSPRSVIEAAYKVLARERHPDHGGSNEAMAELNAAHAKATGAA